MFDSLQDENDKVSWKYRGEPQTLLKGEGPPVAIDTLRGWLFAIAHSEGAEAVLVVADESGTIVHRVGAPSGFSLYYLTNTDEGAVQIVCSTHPAIGGFTDWHFRLENDGTLARSAPAY